VPIPGSLPAATAIAADGTFQVRGIRDGEHRLQMNVPGFYVTSIKYGKAEILGMPFKYSGRASEEIEVTLRDSTATASGKVTDETMLPVSGVNVVFIPVDGSRLELFRTVPTDQNGHYKLTNLAPGEYKAFSWESIDSNAYFDPEFLKKYEPLGKSIVVSESTNSTVDLKLILAQ